LKFIGAIVTFATLFWLLQSAAEPVLRAEQAPPPVEMISPEDVILVADSDGGVLYGQNTRIKAVPASTLKILTALAAIHYLGNSYRFQTEFYLDGKKNLKAKGYGDPLLISEAWQEIAKALASRLQGANDLVVDDSYFVRDIQVPGAGTSTNPYDAPVGALCANFNTVFFKKNPSGHIVSAEPQTPMTPLALKSVRRLGLEKGRLTFTHQGNEIALYAGEVLLHFLRENGMNFTGQIRVGTTGCQDRLVYVHRGFSLEEAIQKMLEFSNNFMANQITVALGAREFGPPGTLEKGILALFRFATEALRLKDIKLVEGSGISRKNRMSALDMLAVLQAFAPYRNLLTRDGNILYKSGTLRGLRARAGYVEGRQGKLFCFVVFLKGLKINIQDVMLAVERHLNGSPSAKSF
jgi:D-alanyl-D-alanine carboxypeptidase/D-alanyl-D-alanine-endopeptidase (penicillin-binding protein 4)